MSFNRNRFKKMVTKRTLFHALMDKRPGPNYQLGRKGKVKVVIANGQIIAQGTSWRACAEKLKVTV